MRDETVLKLREVLDILESAIVFDPDTETTDALGDIYEDISVLINKAEAAE